MSDWRHRAACRDEDPNLFFPIGSTGPSLAWIEDAKAVCLGRCTVVGECLQFALEHGLDGVWGATTEEERRAMKRRAARARPEYGPDLRTEAVRLFQEIRSEFASNSATYEAVAARLGVQRSKTVKAWVEAALGDLATSDAGA
jgi:WhiB family transcriptional regulator, redox-sensing transcriptional regulator